MSLCTLGSGADPEEEVYMDMLELEPVEMLDIDLRRGLERVSTVVDEMSEGTSEEEWLDDDRGARE